MEGGAIRTAAADDDKLDENVNSIVDGALAEVVLVKMNEMEEW